MEIPSIKCGYWQAHPKSQTGGICGKGLYNGRPSFGICAILCTEGDGPWRKLAAEVVRTSWSAPSRPQPPEPSFWTAAATAVKELGAWSAAGWPVARESTIDQRRAICGACPEWDGKARLGLGKCRACRCTRLKFWLATTQCPIGKWSKEQ